MPRKPLIEAGSILPPQGAEGGGDVMSRIIARDREKRGVAEEEAAPPRPTPPLPLESVVLESVVLESVVLESVVRETPPQASKISGSTTNNMTNNITGNTESNTTSNRKPEREGGDDAGTIAEQIRRSLLQSAAPAPLKVITLKLPPDLDRKIEEHCGLYNRKKQDVLRDAVLLYFEMLERVEAEGKVGAEGGGRHPLPL